jgi:hypothetical protein
MADHNRWDDLSSQKAYDIDAVVPAALAAAVAW